MAYILVVNPQILGQAGMPVEDVVLATAFSAAIATLLMGLLANYPFALAPGMGLNAFFTFGVVIGMGVSYQTALAAVFLEGVLFILLTVSGARSAVINAIPHVLKVATVVGIGLFLAMIGLRNGGIVVDHPATLVALGDVTSTEVLTALFGLLITVPLLSRRVPGSLLIGIAAATVFAAILGLVSLPDRIVSAPRLPEETFLAMDFTGIANGELILVILAFLFVDFFDTAGSLIGIGQLGGFLDENGELERADRAFLSDAVGTTVGAMLGTSTVTTYIESATGIEEGGRTGLTAVTVAGLFVLATVFTPLLTIVPVPATAAAIIIVGAMMLKGIKDLPWSRPEELLPAFLAIVAMPYTYSIANGIALGIVSWVALMVFSGRRTEVHWLMYVLALALTLYYGTVGH